MFPVLMIIDAQRVAQCQLVMGLLARVPELAYRRQERVNDLGVRFGLDRFRGIKEEENTKRDTTEVREGRPHAGEKPNNMTHLQFEMDNQQFHYLLTAEMKVKENKIFCLFLGSFR